MKLEASLEHFNPQGMYINDNVKGTSPGRLAGTNVMATTGATGSRARFGLATFLGKIGINRSDEWLAIQALTCHAMELVPRSTYKTTTGEFSWYMLAFAQSTSTEYSRSAETGVKCHSCSGTGRTTREQTIRKVSYP